VWHCPYGGTELGDVLRGPSNVAKALEYIRHKHVEILLLKTIIILPAINTFETSFAKALAAAQLFDLPLTKSCWAATFTFEENRFRGVRHTLYTSWSPVQIVVLDAGKPSNV
jgi:hypothetical protein